MAAKPTKPAASTKVKTAAAPAKGKPQAKKGK